MQADDRRVYEKILLADYLRQDSFDGQKYRQTLDRCLGWLITPEDTATAAHLHFEYLRGRDPDFIPFLKEILGVTDDAEARRVLEERHGARAAGALAAAKARGSY